MKWLLAIPFIFISTPACASEIQITREACQWLARHQPMPDVEYVEGADAHGRRVTPAELPKDNQVVLPETIHIPLNVNLAAYLGITIPLSEPEAYVGTISLGPEGLMFNDKPVQTDSQLLPYCQETALDE